MDIEANEEAIDYSFLLRPVTIGVTLIRFLAAVYILINPLWGLIVSILFDVLDYHVLYRSIHMTNEQYHFWDKNADWLAYATELWVGAQYGAFLPLFLLLFYRFMGQFMFVRHHQRIYFILFPNFYENVFLWVILFHQRFQAMAWPPEPLNWLIFLLLLKLGQEVYMHSSLPKISQARWYKRVQKAIFHENN